MKTRTKILLTILLLGLAPMLIWSFLLLARYFPPVAILLAASLVALLLFAWISNLRHTIKMTNSEVLLSKSLSPHCGTVYGKEPARIARIGEPPPPDMIVDDFGYWKVRCPSCGTESLFHSVTHEFILQKSLPQL